jgi:hypothetical protein
MARASPSSSQAGFVLSAMSARRPPIRPSPRARILRCGTGWTPLRAAWRTEIGSPHADANFSF